MLVLSERESTQITEQIRLLQESDYKRLQAEATDKLSEYVAELYSRMVPHLQQEFGVQFRSFGDCIDYIKGFPKENRAQLFELMAVAASKCLKKSYGQDFLAQWRAIRNFKAQRNLTRHNLCDLPTAREALSTLVLENKSVFNSALESVFEMIYSGYNDEEDEPDHLPVEPTAFGLEVSVYGSQSII